MKWAYGRQAPDNHLLRWVSRRFPGPAWMLDIGSGEGANARELRLRGHGVWTVDVDPSTQPDDPVDIRNFKPGGLPKFDAIYDVNTLCHLEDPPLEKIKSWLKPGGYFFSICPTGDTSQRVKVGKSFTRLASEHDVRELYGGHFSSVTIGSSHYQLPHDEFYESWIIEVQA